MKDNARLLSFAIPGAILGFLALAFHAASSQSTSDSTTSNLRSSSIPQLTERQALLLIGLCSVPVPIVIVPLPAHRDDRETAKKLRDRQDEVRELVHLGLLELASEELVAPIREQMKQTDRGYRIYGLTETGYFLFAGNQNRTAH